jgi:hypothetical protein
MLTFYYIPFRRGVLDTTLKVIKFVSDLQQVSGLFRDFWAAAILLATQIK